MLRDVNNAFRRGCETPLNHPARKAILASSIYIFIRYSNEHLYTSYIEG